MTLTNVRFQNTSGHTLEIIADDNRHTLLVEIHGQIVVNGYLALYLLQADIPIHHMSSFPGPLLAY